MVAVVGRALARGCWGREVGAAVGALFLAGGKAGAGRGQFEIAGGAGTRWTSTVREEPRERGAAFEAVFGTRRRFAMARQARSCFGVAGRRLG